MILHDALVFTPVLGYDVTSVIALTSRIFSHENGDCQLILLSLRFFGWHFAFKTYLISLFLSILIYVIAKGKIRPLS